MKHTLGIDEAGRGPVLGPMVMAAVCLDTRGAQRLTRRGVQDSKRFGSPARARARRAALADEIRAVACHVEVRVVEVDEIDRWVCRGQLNALERSVAGAMIDAIDHADRVVADGHSLFGPLRARYPHLEAHNDGESRHCSVAAASIVAKVRRDELFAAIAARYADEFGTLDGGGYVNGATRRFLRAYARAHGDLPPEARRSWPHDDLRGILGDDFDPRAPIEGRGHKAQLSLFAR